MTTEEFMAERKARKLARQKCQLTRDSKSIAKRRNTLADEEWQALEIAMVRIKGVIDARPEHEHALWNAYADLKSFLEF